MRVAIVGAGPAGITAAVFLKRYDFDVTVFEKEEIGGLIRNAWRIENLPIISPCSGEELAEVLKARLLESNATLVFEEVVSVDRNLLKTKLGTFEFDKIIVASGTVPRRIEEFEVDENVVYEFRKLPKRLRNLAIYGAGDVAFDGALKAREFGVDVHIFNRSNTIKALPRLVSLARNSGIVYHEQEPIIAVERSCNGLRIWTEKGSYDFEGLLICIGRIPNVSFIRTSLEGLEVVGDARGGFRQIAIAMGQAIEVCMKIVEERCLS